MLRHLLHSLVAILIMTAVTLAALEIGLRIADFRELREGVSERSLSYAYDAELGWAPVRGSTSVGVVASAPPTPEARRW
ncbi:hypothetical protein [Bradyrhizobium sp. CCBAU 11434]|uniref:hypothetical protein n=1 Tax=Bradyrhizobium sp. CCBAU 11434 TaxID=1630885 RepID=UPI002305FB33|nr:hypothetical protein [Bradyrhizobium sp. CCBAU 11434]